MEPGRFATRQDRGKERRAVLPLEVALAVPIHVYHRKPVPAGMQPEDGQQKKSVGGPGPDEHSVQRLVWFAGIQRSPEQPLGELNVVGPRQTCRRGGVVGGRRPKQALGAVPTGPHQPASLRPVQVGVMQQGQVLFNRLTDALLRDQFAQIGHHFAIEHEGVEVVGIPAGLDQRGTTSGRNALLRGRRRRCRRGRDEEPLAVSR